MSTAPRLKPWEKGFLDQLKEERATSDAPPSAVEPPPPVAAPSVESGVTSSAQPVPGQSTAAATDATVDQAVRFLDHPKTADMPIAAKRAFLVSKGMTSQQIDAAIEKSKRTGADTSESTPAAAAPATVTAEPAAPAAKSSSTGGGGGGMLWYAGAALLGAAAVVAGRWALGGAAIGESAAGGRGAATGGMADEEGALPPTNGRAATERKLEAPAGECGTKHAVGAGVAANLAALRGLVDALPSSSTAAGGAKGEQLRHALGRLQAAGPAEAARALRTLLVFTNNQLKHPADRRYHRINCQNANFRRVLDTEGVLDVLQALGWDKAGGFWEWRSAEGAAVVAEGGVDAVGGLPTEVELGELQHARDAMQDAAAALEATA